MPPIGLILHAELKEQNCWNPACGCLGDIYLQGAPLKVGHEA